MYQLFIYTQFGTVLKFEFASIKRAIDHGDLYSTAGSRKVVKPSGDVYRF